VGALFDAYLVVDWSARSGPSPARPTPDSIWIGERAGSAAREWNPRTRRAARDLLEERLALHSSAGRRVICGFDFALGYPAGFARSLGLQSVADGAGSLGAGAGSLGDGAGSLGGGAGSVGDGVWREAWRELERLVVDGADNANNRFTVAAELNRRCGGVTPGPFWGCPPAYRSETLASVSPGYPYPAGSAELPRLRHTDRGAVQPVWKLYGNGSVGSQTLLGIPVAAYLRFQAAFHDRARVWPFESGFGVPESPIVYAEVWPTLARPHYDPSVGVKDQMQVRATALWLSTLDADDQLAALFGRPDGLSDEAIAQALEEEGWILGIP
jgi:hypothetical protein